MLTRRHFLQLLGVSAASLTVDPLRAFVPVLPLPVDRDEIEFVGRILNTTPIFASPSNIDLTLSPHVPPHRFLSPNSVHPILDIGDNWVRIAQGFIPKQTVQPIPIVDYNPPTSIDTSPLGAQSGRSISVSAPYAVVRDRAHISASALAYIGHGGVMQLRDYLPPASPHDVAWYGVRVDTNSVDEHAPLGWTQAHLWRDVDASMTAPLIDPTRRIEIDLATHYLTAYQADEAVLSAPISHNQYAVRGDYSIDSRWLSASISAYPPIHGIPYVLRFGYPDSRMSIIGAYWHNAFGMAGMASNVRGHAVQVPVYVARWLYHWLPDGAPVIVY